MITRSSARRAALAVALLLFASAGNTAERPDPEHSIDIGTGLYVPISGDNRDAYGTGGMLTFGVASRLGWKSTWLTLDFAAIRSKGDEFFTDGTFDFGQSEYWLYPVTFGFRFNAASDGENLPVRLYLGLGLQTIFTTYSPPLDESSSSPLFGVLGELRPEISLGEKSSLYLRQRVFISGDVDYDSRIRDINYSGTSLEAGLNYRIR